MKNSADIQALNQTSAQMAFYIIICAVVVILIS